MENDKMKALCQGFYRDTSKFLIAAYLRDNQPEKAAKEWKRLLAKIDEYVCFCQKIRSCDKSEVIQEFGQKAADNMEHYTREWIDGKLQFMLGQLKSWSDEKIFTEFEKQI